MKRSSIVSEVVLVLDNNRQVIVASPDANKLFLYNKGELIGMSSHDVITNANTLIDKFEHNVIKEKRKSRIWKKINGINSLGEKFPIKICFDQFADGENIFTVAFIAKTVDMMEKTDKTKIINSSSVIHLIMDRHANITLINLFGSHFVKCPQNTLKGLNWSDYFLPPDQLEIFNKILEQAFLNGENKNYEIPVISLAGDVYNVRWVTQLIYNSNDKPIATLNTGIVSQKNKTKKNMIKQALRLEKLIKQRELIVEKQHVELLTLLNNLEITNSDLQEQISKRKESEQKLMRFQRLYDTMIHNFPDGVIGILNKEMEYILIDGMELHDIDLPALGLHSQNSGRHDPVLARETIREIKKAFEGKNVSFEVNTSDRSYSITAVPLPDEENQIKEILCVLKNVTEKNRVERVLLNALEREKELGELKSRFVTMACHEFKTPLATILSSTFLLENYSGEEYDNEKLLHSNRIRRSVNNLNTILNEFLSIETQNGHDVQIVPTIIEIPKYIKDVLMEVEPLRKNGQVVEYNHSSEQQFVDLDQHLLWSILTNLIGNALKYSRQGDVIQVNTSIENEHLLIKVKDNGIGIPQEDHHQIFERFHRAPNAFNYDGTGLGLHIVRKNVNLLKGSISFESELNKGTEFTVKLPMWVSNGIDDSIED